MYRYELKVPIARQEETRELLDEATDGQYAVTSESSDLEVMGRGAGRRQSERALTAVARKVEGTLERLKVVGIYSARLP